MIGAMPVRLGEEEGVIWWAPALPASIDEYSRTVLRQRRVTSSLDAHPTDEHALHGPWCVALHWRLPALP